MPTPNNTVSLLIAGKTHSQWTDYDIDSDLLTPADDFQVTLGRPVDAKPDAVQPGDTVEVRVGEDTVLSGRIDRVSTSTAKGQKTLTISGRDDAGILLDCSCPIFNAQDMDLKQIIDTIVKPLGISKIRIDAAQTARTNKVQIEPGSRAWDALAQYAEANGLWPWLEPDGTLVIGGPDYTTKPVADLIVRVSGQGNNVEQLQVERDFSQRYSEITVLGQSHSGKGSIEALYSGYRYTLYTKAEGAFTTEFDDGVSATFSSSKGDSDHNNRKKRVVFDASRSVPTADENRPRNIALLACIKI